jgi:hypothetical protein
MDYSIAKFLFAAFLALSTIVSTSSAFSVDGAIFSEEVSPGQEIVHEMIVSAGEDELLPNMTAKIVGFAMTEDGANIELPPGDDSERFSARPFLSVEPTSFDLEPGERWTLNLTGIVPEDVGEGGRYALVTIKTAPKESENASVMIITAIQVPILLTIKDSDLEMTGEISGLVASMADGNVSVDLLLENTGNVHYKPFVGANLLNEDDEVVASVVPAETRRSILPTGSRLVSMTLVPEAELEPGTYTVEATVALDDGTVLDTAETTIEV